MSTASCRVGESFRRLQWMLGFLLTIQVYSREIYVGLENPFGGGGGIDFGYQDRMFGGTEDGEALQEEVGPPKKRGGAGDTTKIRVDVMTLVFGMIYMRGSGH